MGDDYLLYFVSIQACKFKNLIDTIKDNIPDINFIFDKTGMKILAINKDHSLLIDTKLHANKFERYVCNKNVLSIGINFINLNKYLKSINNYDHICFYIENDNENELNIKIENNVKKVKNIYTIDIMDLNQGTVTNYDNKNYDDIIMISSNDLQILCRSFSNVITDTVEIKKIDNNLIFRCKGEFGSQRTIFVDEVDEKEDKSDLKKKKCEKSITFLKQSEEIYQGKFNIKYFHQFTKCKNLSNYAKIHLLNDNALMISYSVGNMGYIKFFLANKN